MTVENIIKPFEINDLPTDAKSLARVYVRSVHNKPDCVEIQIGQGERIVVFAAELNKAIKNATDNID